MQITDAKWIDAEHSGIVAVVDGVRTGIPPDPKNRHYAAILAEGISVSEPD
jgi:hypothetical protein